MGIALKAEHIAIRYITGDFKDIGIKEYVVRNLTHNYHVQEFMAVDDVSFELEQGDMLGIIGMNGAGKSTLLKAVAGIMEPTRGKITSNGEIAALLELGSGFDGELTVRENAYLRGAMLGYTQAFMDETYEQIIDFAELREFEDRPFKQLSSGMKSRLAFSIASLVHPDILILDEVLSVGDGAFQKKSAEKMREIIAQGATTILVSHSLEQIRELCNKVLWLDHGHQVCFGETEEICDLYEAFLHTGVLPVHEQGNTEDLPESPAPVDVLSAGTESISRDNGGRLVNFDLARSFAIFSVVFCHSVESFYYMYQDRMVLWEMLGQSSKLFDLMGFTFGRLGVPIFLFLTGALVLNQTFECEGDFTRFYRKKYIPLFAVMSGWTVIWNLYLIGYRTMGGETGEIRLQTILKSALFQRVVDTIMPAWYIPMILGVYLFLPFLAIAVKKVSFKVMAFPFTVAGIMLFLIPSVNLFCAAFGKGTIDNFILDIGFSGGIFGLYIVAGYYLCRGLGSRFPAKLLVLLAVCSYLECVFLQYQMMESGQPYKMEYNFFPLFVCSACLFEGFRRIPSEHVKLPELFTGFSKISLAIFFLHNPIQYSIYLSGLLNHMSRPAAVFCMFILSFGLSAVVAVCLGKIRWLKRFVGIK